MYLQTKRKRMVENLIRKGISSEKVIKAMEDIPRHKFVAPGLESKAYEEMALPIGYEQTISHPYTVALMSQVLDINHGDKVLEIGTGSGYQSAILANLGGRIFSIERICELSEKAKSLLDNLNLNVTLKCADGTKGWMTYAPYDAIIVTAGAPVSPDSLKNQLKENGKLLIPIGNREEQMLTLFIKSENKLNKIEIEKLSFVPLIGQEGWNS